MDILNTVSLESNSQIKINFNGGDLSSDAGLLLLKEVCYKIGAVKLVRRLSKTNDSAWHHIHKDDENLLQAIYQIFASYFEDDYADELTNEPVMTTVLKKEALASQPALSRFFNHMDGKALEQFNQILRELRKVICSIKMPGFMLFDIDTTFQNAYGSQEGAAFNYHYQDKGYHPLLAFDGLTDCALVNKNWTLKLYFLTYNLYYFTAAYVSLYCLGVKYPREYAGRSSLKNFIYAAISSSIFSPCR